MLAGSEWKEKQEDDMSVISMKQLLEAGVHFGHQTRRWNPKMAPYIFTERNGIYIIDLQQTVTMFDEAYEFVKSVAAEGKPVLFVGTKKQAQNAIKDEAERCGEYFVSERWLGGMLTNHKTIGTRIKRLKKEKIAIKEAKILGIPVVGIADTNCDPDDLDYIIPGNDDAIRAIKLFAGKLADAVIEAHQGESFDEGVSAEEQMAQAAESEAKDIEEVVAEQ